ncbi:MAG: hypothetical protein ACREB6_04900 [Rhodospirillales bacterium]
MNPEFDRFLFAPISEDTNGMPTSVISALARLNIDPWQEAARLSELPKEGAAAALCQLISRLPGDRREQSDTQKITTRLIGLLPLRDPADWGGKEKISGREKVNNYRAAFYLVFLGLAATVLYAMI